MPISLRGTSVHPIQVDLLHLARNEKRGIGCGQWSLWGYETTETLGPREIQRGQPWPLVNTPLSNFPGTPGNLGIGTRASTGSGGYTREEGRGCDGFGWGRVYDVRIAVLFVKEAGKWHSVSRCGGDATGSGGRRGFGRVTDGVLSSHFLRLVPVPV